jgi:hypothetical protein
MGFLLCRSPQTHEFSWENKTGPQVRETSSYCQHTEYFVSSTSIDVDPSSVSGQTEVNAYIRVQQLSCGGISTSKSFKACPVWSDTDRQIPDCDRQPCQLCVSSETLQQWGACKEWLAGWSSGHHLAWPKCGPNKPPRPNLNSTWNRARGSPQSHTRTETYTHSNIYLTGTRQYICNWHTIGIRLDYGLWTSVSTPPSTPTSTNGSSHADF